MENIKKILEQDLLQIKLSSGVGKTSYTISPKMLNQKIGEKNEATVDFLSTNLLNGRILFYHKSIIRQIKNIQNSVRSLIANSAVGVSSFGYFISEDKFARIENQFKAAREEFFEVQEEILEKYDMLKTVFSKKLSFAFRDLDVPEAEIQMILSKFPEKEEIKNSFYFDIDVLTYPKPNKEVIRTENILEMVEKSYEKNLIADFHKIIGTNVKKVAMAIVKVREIYEKKNEIPKKTEKAFSLNINEVAENNDLLKIEELDKILLSISKNDFETNSPDVFFETILTLCYDVLKKYSQVYETNFLSFCGYEEEELETLLSDLKEAEK